MPPVEFTYLQQLTDTEISVIRHRKTFMADAKLQLAAFIAGKHPLAKEWGFHPPSQDPKEWDFDEMWAVRNFIVHLQKQAVELATDLLDELHPRSYGDPDLLPVSETLKPFTLNGRDAIDVVAGTIFSDKSNVRDWYSQQFLQRRFYAYDGANVVKLIYGQ